MTLEQIRDMIGGVLLTKEEGLKIECSQACSSDLMSDVLAFSKARCVLLTGLVNIQVVRTAEMMDVKAIVFVRGKAPSAEIVALAEAKGIAVLRTDKTLFETSGLLYTAGLGSDSL